uniref:Uncharacterized protein n=1 Tax=Trichobilharzia regenti TaxID=157069 RepID=A0AA85JAA1_TRIRE|nr:unnamed protein product [Trichobilharzia regenti]
MVDEDRIFRLFQIRRSNIHTVREDIKQTDYSRGFSFSKEFRRITLGQSHLTQKWRRRNKMFDSFFSQQHVTKAKGRGVYFSSSVGRSSSCESLVTKERCEDASNDLKQLRAFIVTEIKTYENIIEGIKFEIQEKEEWLADIKNLIKSFYKTVVVGGFSERLKTITTSCFIHHMELRSKQLNTSLLRALSRNAELRFFLKQKLHKHHVTRNWNEPFSLVAYSHIACEHRDSEEIYSKVLIEAKQKRYYLSKLMVTVNQIKAHLNEELKLRSELHRKIKENFFTSRDIRSTMKVVNQDNCRLDDENQRMQIFIKQNNIPSVSEHIKSYINAPRSRLLRRQSVTASDYRLSESSVFERYRGSETF